MKILKKDIDNFFYVIFIVFILNSTYNLEQLLVQYAQYIVV